MKEWTIVLSGHRPTIIAPGFSPGKGAALGKEKCPQSAGIKKVAEEIFPHQITIPAFSIVLISVRPG